MNINEPFVIRETPATLLPLFRDRFPGAKFYQEQRMDLFRGSFVPKHRGFARQLKIEDAQALAEFFGAPPQAAGKFSGWLRGAKAFMGVFEGDRLVAIGSSMVAVPESWNLVSIETHRDFRGRGFATEIVSSIASRAFQETNTVTVTVVKDNVPAIKTYERVGFRFAEDRVWVDNGVGAAP